MKSYREYKESRIEWLDKIPSSWNEIAIKRLASLKSGENITSQEIDQDGQYAVYGGNGIRGFYSEFTHDGNFVLIGRQGALCGNINYAKGKFWATEHAVVATPKREYKLVWFGELLRTMNLNQYSMAAAQPGLSVERIENLKVPLPSLPEQQAISDFLDRKTAQIGTLIEKKQQQIDLLQEQRIALINHAVTKGQDRNNVRQRYNSAPWLFPLPSGWKRQQIKFNSYMKGRIGYQNLRSEEYTEEGPYLVSSTHFRDGSIEWEKCNHVTKERFEMAPEIILQKDDVLFMKDGALMGKLAYVNDLPGEACLNSHLLVMRPLSGIYLPRFLFYVLMTDIFETYMIQKRTGTTFFGMSQESMGNFPISLPPIEEQKEICAYLDKQTQKAKNAIKKINEIISVLQEYRTALISEAVTGKIDVRTAV